MPRQWLAILLILTGCRSEAAQSDVMIFEVATPVAAQGFFERAYVGEARATQYAELRTRVKGIIQAVEVDEGQAVTEGQLLFTLDAKLLQREVAKAQASSQSAEAELHAAQLELQNSKRLRDKNVVSDAEVALNAAKVRALEAKLSESRTHASQMQLTHSYAQIRAPFAGRIFRIPKKAGSLVDEDELLTTISNTDEVFVYFHVPEHEAIELTANSAAKEVYFDTQVGRFANPGVIDSVGSQVDKATGTVSLRARFANRDGQLKHGSTGKIAVQIPTVNALQVPQKATFEVQEHLYVYVVDNAGVVRARSIEPLTRQGDVFVIQKGLTPTDRFIVEGIQKVKEGDKIMVRQPTVKATQ